MVRWLRPTWRCRLRQVSRRGGEEVKEGASRRVMKGLEQARWCARAFLEVNDEDLAVAVRARGKGEGAVVGR
jgi:hypothetical protein